MLLWPVSSCADLWTERAMRRQTPHSSSNNKIGLGCNWAGGLCVISFLERPRHRCEDARYSRARPIGSPGFSSIQKHEQSWRSLDPVGGCELLLDGNIDPEDPLFAPQHLCHLLEDWLQQSAVAAAVRHELDGNGSNP